MSSANFAAAQQRVLERRRARETESRARLAAQQRASPVNPTAVQRLPFPLNRFSLSSGWFWNSITGREGNRPAFRVGQVDAELLDEELLDLLRGQVGEALKYYGVCWLFFYFSNISTGCGLLTCALGSLICAKIGRMRFSWCSGVSCLSYRYGITMPRMARPCRT